MIDDEQENLPEVLRARREKLRRIQEAGGEGYARSYRRTHTTQQARALLGDGEGPTEPVRVAGRLVGSAPTAARPSPTCWTAPVAFSSSPAATCSGKPRRPVSTSSISVTSSGSKAR